MECEVVGSDPPPAGPNPNPNPNPSPNPSPNPNPNPSPNPNPNPNPNSNPNLYPFNIRAEAAAPCERRGREFEVGVRLGVCFGVQQVPVRYGLGLGLGGVQQVPVSYGGGGMGHGPGTSWVLRAMQGCGGKPGSMMSMIMGW